MPVALWVVGRCSCAVFAACSFACSVPFLYLHAVKGCSGIESFTFNAVFNLLLLALFSDFKRRTYAAPAKRAKRA